MILVTASMYFDSQSQSRKLIKEILVVVNACRDQLNDEASSCLMELGDLVYPTPSRPFSGLKSL